MTDLGRGEHLEPLGSDQGAETTDERRSLFLDLSLHSEVRQVIHVLDPAEDSTGYDSGL